MNEREQADQQLFLQRVRSGLDASAEAIPAETATYLRLARERALAVQTKRLQWQWRMAVPMGIAASVLVAGLWLQPSVHSSLQATVQPSSSAMDAALFDTIARPESDIELYDNLEFYQWLSDDDDAPASTATTGDI